MLGPRLFIMYVAELADFVEERQVNFHSFADDSQLYLHCLPSRVASVVGHWMSANRLRLNTDKTELVWIGSR